MNNNLPEESVIISSHDGLSLDGYLSTPPGTIQGIALLLSGSGSVGENGDVSGPFVGVGYQGQEACLSWQLRDRLSSEGFVTLRYAKRDIQSQSISNLLADAKTAAMILQNRYPDFDLTVVGFSEGAILAGLLSSELENLNLHLISLLTQPVEKILHYQTIEWPMQLLVEHFDSQRTGRIKKEDLFALDVTALPGVGFPVQNLVFDEDGTISIQEGIRPIYDAQLEQMKNIVQMPVFKCWYESMEKLVPVSEILAKFPSKKLNIYQGLLDSQINPTWVSQDPYLRPFVRVFDHLGHCMAPMSGQIGQNKASGPFSPEFMEQLVSNL